MTGNERLPQYPNTSYKFLIEGSLGVYGHLLQATVQRFTWNEHWEVDHHEQTVRLLGSSFDERRDRFEKTLQAKREKGTFRTLKNWRGERFPIYGPGRELIVDFERAAATLFGVATYGV